MSGAITQAAAYDLIDRFLRSNLYDDDYAKYSEALEAISQPAPSPQPAVPVVSDDILIEREYERVMGQHLRPQDRAGVLKVCRAILALRPAVEPMTLPPVEGDVLPAIGSKVLIHLASSDLWVEHEVVGYYVWEAINELAKPRHHRVFVRVRDTDGILNARHICDLRGITAKAEGGA